MTPSTLVTGHVAAVLGVAPSLVLDAGVLGAAGGMYLREQGLREYGLCMSLIMAGRPCFSLERAGVVVTLWVELRHPNPWAALVALASLAEPGRRTHPRALRRRDELLALASVVLSSGDVRVLPDNWEGP